MTFLKRFFKRNSHNLLFKGISTFGRVINRIYENRNHDIQSNGEAWLIRKIASINPSVIFDVGANTGKYAIELKRYSPHAHVYCFEPVSSTFELLQNNLKNYKDITYVQAGLYSEPKELTINIYPSSTHASLYDLKAVPYESLRKEKIQLISGDQFIQENKIAKVDFIKLDVEGSELDALKGLSTALQNKVVRLIQFEYGYINITTKNLLVDYYDLLSRHNYIIGKLYPKKVEFRKYNFKYEDFIGPNMIAIHSEDTELLNLLS